MIIGEKKVDNREKRRLIIGDKKKNELGEYRFVNQPTG